MTTGPGGVADHEEQHRLTAVQGLAALSLDALSSVAYGPEAILVVLVAAGATALHYSLPITGAIVVLLTALVISYRQVIAAFPNGGGAYAVSKARYHGLGPAARFRDGGVARPRHRRSQPRRRPRQRSGARTG
jgi:amino acid transporter